MEMDAISLPYDSSCLCMLQSALTGESLPVTKGPGDGVYSGSTCKQGEIESVVIATGVHTFFGKAAHLVDSTNQVGHFQKARLCSLSIWEGLCHFLVDTLLIFLSFHCLGLDCNWKLLYMFDCGGDGN